MSDSYLHKKDRYVESLEKHNNELAEDAAATTEALEKDNESEEPPVAKSEDVKEEPTDKPDYEGELGRAIVGGGIDIINSVGSLPKFFDKRFYQETDPNNPYTYDAPWLIKQKPIMKTQWGSFVRGGVELIGGLVGTGKVMWGVKGLRGVITASRATRIGRVGLSAVQGATYDIISNQSQEQNLARALIDIKPQWAGILSAVATREDMSPFQKSIMNVGEGLGIGGLFDISFEALGHGVRSYSINAKDAAKSGSVNPITKAIEDSSNVDYTLKTNNIETGAKKAYEKSLHRRLKAQGKTTDGIATWRKKTNPWEALDQAQRDSLMQIYADKNNIDWGPNRDVTRRGVKQGEANDELAAEQLSFDLLTGKPRRNPAYYDGGDVTDNQALSSSSKPVKGVRDMIEIRNDPTQKYGSPRGTMTEANIRRSQYTAPGMMTAERDALAKQLVAEPAYQKLYGEGSSEAINKDLVNATSDLIRFINDSGHSRLIDVDENDVLKYIRSKDANRPTAIEGIGVLNKSQLVSTDVILGQLLYEARDLAKAALSVANEVDVAAPGSLLDGILARYAAIARLRKETSMLSSFNLARFKSGGKLKDSAELASVRGQASDAAAQEVATFKQLLQNDVDDDLLESFIHFAATSNGRQQTWKDLQAFYKRRLHGYREGSKYQRNAILNELATMGVNSMLSGPKTPARALIGTGLGTIMRPVSTLLGALNDDQTIRSSFATISGMLDARTDAWRKAVAEFQSYSLNEEGFRNLTTTRLDREWNALMQFHQLHGSPNDKVAAHFADQLRNLNKNPFLNYGPRVMQSMDTFFTQIIGRGRLRQIAFDNAYAKLQMGKGVVSDQDLKRVIDATELEFESRVFDADGQVSDTMAKFAADEAKLTAELEGWVKDLDRVFEKAPFLRPFFLFARTGVNALNMTSKYTPILNRFIKEHSDIMSKNFDDEGMLRYGIKTQRDLELAQATMRGRMAIGWGVTSTAALMALNGQVTGNGPPDRGLRNSWIQAGWQPRSIKIGSHYVSYEAIEPFNMFFSFTADIVDSQSVMGEAWVNNWLSKTAYLISANVTNKSFLAGLLQLQDLLTSQGGDVPRVAANFLNNQLPLAGLRNEIGKAFSPGMRELESGFWQSIGNRNLYIDILGENRVLPYRYDILNGEKIRDWDPFTRLVNGMLPFNINVGTNETREWLFRSGINFKQTFNTGPRGQDLDERPDLKSKFQFYMGQQNIEAQLTTLFANPSIRESILKMEEDRASGRKYEAAKTLHGDMIRSIFRNAKLNAWNMLTNENSDARRLDHLHQLEQLGDRQRRLGNYKSEQNTANEIERFEQQMKVK